MGRSRVSIHAPWEGCDKYKHQQAAIDNMFQFTHPGKGATGLYSPCHQNEQSFNSRTLGRVRLNIGTLIHRVAGFNSRTLGRVRRHASAVANSKIISFNSRTLGRVRPSLERYLLECYLFQFTHPGKGATKRRVPIVGLWEFQFTHPGKGATQAYHHTPRLPHPFQFTHPGKGATCLLT